MWWLVVSSLALRLPSDSVPRRTALLQGDAVTRRTALLQWVGVLSIGHLGQPASASYGEAAVQAPPALTPSPVRPTGAMADTCEVVALGREDVCLEPKKLLSSYEGMKLNSAIESLQDLRVLDSQLQKLIEATQKSAQLTQGNQFTELATVAESIDTEGLPKPVLASLTAIGVAAKKREASPAAKAIIKLADQVSQLAAS